MRSAASRVRSVPGSLALLLCAVGVFGVCWALIIPPGQAPDEPPHIGYAQVVAEDLRLPDESPGRTYSREQEMAMARSNALQTAQIPATRPEWSALAERRWEREAEQIPASTRGDGGHADTFYGPNKARANPPMYYLYTAAAYRAAGGDFFDRLFAMRLWSVLLLLVSTAATWLLIGELIGPRRELQLVGAALVGLQPMAVFVSSSVNPDALLIASFALSLWLGVRILRRGLTFGSGIALGGAAALAVLTKGTGYALVPAVVLAIGVGAWRLGRPWRRRALIAGASALALAIPVAIWLAISWSLDRSPVNEVPEPVAGASPVHNIGLLDYVWQFYLPKPPFLGAVPGIERLPAYDVWIKTGWGAFGWLEVRFPEPVYVVLAALTVFVIAGGLFAALRRGGRADIFVGAYFALVVLCLLAGLHWIEWRSLNTSGATFNQGRYLLPLLPLLGACAAGTLALMPARLRFPAVGVLLGALFALEMFSIWINVDRFYA